MEELELKLKEQIIEALNLEDITPEDIAELVWFFLYMRGNAVVDEIIVHRSSKQPFLV